MRLNIMGCRLKGMGNWVIIPSALKDFHVFFFKVLSCGKMSFFFFRMICFRLFRLSVFFLGPLVHPPVKIMPSKHAAGNISMQQSVLLGSDYV